MDISDIEKNMNTTGEEPDLFETPIPPLSALLAGFFEESMGYRVRRSAGTRDWLISYTVGGLGEYRLGGQTVQCQAGDIVLLSPGAEHDYRTQSQAEGWIFYWAHFLPRPGWVAWLKLPEVSPGLAFFSITELAVRQRIEEAFRRMVRDNAELGILQEELSQNALEEVLILIARLQQRLLVRPLDQRVAEVQDYLEQHYNQRVSLAELAQLVSLSPWRLSHLYKTQTGQTISQTLLRLRLRQAARLLAFTSRQIVEIAEIVGFQSPFHFSRQFKDIYGVSPQTYRREIQDLPTVSGNTRGELPDQHS